MSGTGWQLERWKDEEAGGVREWVRGKNLSSLGCLTDGDEVRAIRA